jgi:hypothetical protein
MLTLFLIITGATAAYYLASRAKITEPLWSRYPTWIEYWTLCAACSGLAYGVGITAALGYGLDLWVVPAAGGANLALGAAVGMVWTPILAFLMVQGWSALLTVDEDEDDDLQAE